MTPDTFLKATQHYYQQVESRQLQFVKAGRLEIPMETGGHKAKSHEVALYELKDIFQHPFWIRRMFREPKTADQIRSMAFTMNLKIYIP